MSRYVLSPRAQADLDEIWDYTASRWGVRQAEAYIRVIHSTIETLAVDPDRARPCPEIRAGYWKYPAGAHVIFLRRADRAIDVVRILHGRMDFERHL